MTKPNANMIGEFFEVFLLENKTVTEKKDTKFKWTKDQKNRNDTKRLNYNEIKSTISANQKELTGTIKTLEKYEILFTEKQGKNIAPVQAFVSLLDNNQKNKFGSLIEYSTKPENEQEFSEWLTVELLKDYKPNLERNQINVDWTLSEKVRGFWQQMDIHSIDTVYTEAKVSQWERKEIYIKEKQSEVRKETRIEFVWNGEKHKGVLLSKEYPTKNGKELYAYELQIDGEQLELEQTINKLYSYLDEKSQEGFDFLRGLERMNLNEMISILSPLYRQIETIA